MIDLRRVPERWHRLDVTVRDLPLALGLAGAAFVPALRDYGTQVGELPARPLDGPALVVIALECLPLAVRRRWPAVCVALVSLGFAMGQVSGHHSFAGNAVGIALVSAGAHLDRRRRLVASALSASYVVLAVALDRLSGAERVDELVTFYLVMALAWGIGAWLRSTRVAEVERRLRVAEETRAAERTRIARELHDVVTHHVTAMVVQAEAARYLTAAPDRLDESLTAVADTGRRAIGDLRNLLDLLDPGHEGAVRTLPGAGLRLLVEQSRQAGQPVELTEVGTPAEPAGSAEQAAHRVVQESLTNALKHAHGRPTAVSVHYDDREITVEVSTDGPGAGTQDGAGPGSGPGSAPGSRGAPAGSGRGLAGLRERVAALGGELDTRRRDDGGFVVLARIPTGSRS
ncbi:sensor histidine kinase [Antribacter gilvus]|uniref:sensor histidine kinase n=1 Tax=Antribacter gilvus TaxID=2304675 RepID=UPI000F799E50|nr:histidine kinase [Antribacter gilvus]